MVYDSILMNRIARIVCLLACVWMFPQWAMSACSGKEIYQHYCYVCHDGGLAGAPQFRSKQWRQRCMTKHRSGLLVSAMQGLNAMPAKGTCATCNIHDIQAAIDYMVPINETECHKK